MIELFELFLPFLRIQIAHNYSKYACLSSLQNRYDSILHFNFSTANFAVCYPKEKLKNAARKILSKTFRIIEIG